MQQPPQHLAHQHGKVTAIDFLFLSLLNFAHTRLQYQHPPMQYLMKPDYNGENISVTLQNRDLWNQFNKLTNEMM